MIASRSVIFFTFLDFISLSSFLAKEHVKDQSISKKTSVLPKNNLVL